MVGRSIARRIAGGRGRARRVLRLVVLRLVQVALLEQHVLSRCRNPRVLIWKTETDADNRLEDHIAIFDRSTCLYSSLLFLLRHPLGINTSWCKFSSFFRKQQFDRT